MAETLAQRLAAYRARVFAGGTEPFLDLACIDEARMLAERAQTSLTSSPGLTGGSTPSPPMADHAESEWLTVEAERVLYLDDGQEKVLCDRLPSPVTLVIKLATSRPKNPSSGTGANKPDTLSGAAVAEVLAADPEPRREFFAEVETRRGVIHRLVNPARAVLVRARPLKRQTPTGTATQMGFPALVVTDLVDEPEAFAARVAEILQEHL